MPITQTRRRFLATTVSAGAAGLLRPSPVAADDERLETTSVRFFKNAVICVVPQYAAESLLRAEGFTDVSYVEVQPADEVPKAIADGRVDFTMSFAVNHIQTIDRGAPITILGGVHIGCYELFAREGIGSITELKGKQVGLQTGSPALLRLMATQVGLDPDKDLRWVTDPKEKPLELFAQGKIDAFLGFPPEPQELRARGASHVILSTAVDRPWSQYFCCMLGGSREYVRRYPVATKRVLRAVLKATDLCVGDPAGIAHRLVDGGFTPRFDLALATLSEVPYDRWRDYDAEDSIRFYALRLREAGLIKATPQKLIAEHTDWHFLNELKHELKA